MHHQALFNPQDGRCTKGPCEGDYLLKINTIQKNGEFVGGGGSGAYGGAACGILSSGGGGGSGYTNGSVNLLFGQVGGNGNSQASALIELITNPGQKFLFLVRGV